MFELYYGITSIILGVALFFPVRKFMLAIGANRKSMKLKRELTEEEVMQIRKKVGIYAAIISITFAFMFNKVVLLRALKGV
jgi:hypothetical protein